jgi:hypothetical protein
VEKRLGCGILARWMYDPRQLLAKYNEVAAEQNAAARDKRPL